MSDLKPKVGDSILLKVKVLDLPENDYPYHQYEVRLKSGKIIYLESKDILDSK